MLQVEDIHVSYGQIRAIKGITFEVREGEIVALIGANGAGKSTTLMALSGMVPIMTGKVLFSEKRIDNIPPELIVRMGISQVPEGRRIFPQLTVEENLDMGAFLRKDVEEIANDRRQIFSLFPRLAERRKQLGETLSGGEQQMLAISRALMARPRFLLMDEPSLGLAPLIVRQIFEIIHHINKERGTTVLLVEQNANLALKLASRAYVMETGRITLGGSTGELQRNEKVREAYLGL